jgi:hypothetical protein
MNKYTKDDREPLYPGLMVHVAGTEGECIDGLVTDKVISTNSPLEIDGSVRYFDRAGECETGVPGSWHFADHSEWRPK